MSARKLEERVSLIEKRLGIKNESSGKIFIPLYTDDGKILVGADEITITDAVRGLIEATKLRKLAHVPERYVDGRSMGERED